MISRRQFNKHGAATVAGMALAQAIASEAEAQASNGPVSAIESRTMRAARMTAFRRPLQVGEVPVAAPRADGAVVRVEACGVSRSDWHLWKEDWGWMGLDLPLPTVLGHEGGRCDRGGRA